MVTHVHPHGSIRGWPQTTTPARAVKPLPRHLGQRPEKAWTRLFYTDEPQPWHGAQAIFGILVVLLYLAGLIALPFLIG